ncbi:16S rRNA (cytidine(1402)-2'-O)-methyltransferase [Paraglaciecola aquimarina]|uniref:Ribosomal RNA small subunit methyltransferase I n=1 Tax=Paraglaciecola aquimarina TaxID=1235557 RepID=A0ABU3SVL0_9ALTE|nr:16S rRNA (cytidine(1402)-2'-O)-methyltransferase [Paraglaciecola aquimarina]MDU0354058.1 16S rRNA (cytidine(1402)-2'-O)-methyltransferase [Paraglaciecola aquimarina]
MLETSTLFIVPTPIGNLEDITHRALRILSEVDLIAAEDTRHSQKLMQHYNISTRLISLHDHNESQRASQLISKLESGDNIALISDAGTPLISDPGYGLVSQCRDAGVNVVPLPAPCAAITALSGAGLATDKFQFEGFLPVKALARQQALEKLIKQTRTSVFYESPRRILDTVKLIAQVLGSERRLVLAKELTKTFETFYSDSAGACVTWLEEDANHQRGEFVLMVAGDKPDQSDVSAEALKLLSLLMKELPLKKAAAITAEQFGLKKNQLYQIGLDR